MLSPPPPPPPFSFPLSLPPPLSLSYIVKCHLLEGLLCCLLNVWKILQNIKRLFPSFFWRGGVTLGTLVYCVLFGDFQVNFFLLCPSQEKDQRQGESSQAGSYFQFNPPCSSQTFSWKPACPETQRSCGCGHWRWKHWPVQADVDPCSHHCWRQENRCVQSSASDGIPSALRRQFLWGCECVHSVSHDVHAGF